jgi:NAD-dependent dihydropyrimidine dehydrogenase PreA subunit
MPVEQIDHDKCIRCGTCVETCPKDVLRRDKETRRPVIRHQEDCQICHLCLVYCPKDAITITPEKRLTPMVGWR